MSDSLEDHDPIGIGPLAVVLHTPAVRGLREFLLIHHHEESVKRESFGSVPYQTFKKHLAVPNLANLERDMPSWTYYPRQFDQRLANHVLPARFGSVVRDRDGRHVDASEPAS